MKFRHLLLATAVLSLGVATVALAGKDEAGKPVIARRVALCNSAGLVGPQDISPFVSVPVPVEISDTTSADTMLTSTAVWVNKSLYRLVKDHESRVDVEGPTDLTVISMVPFKNNGLGFKMDYTISVRIDDGEPQIVDLHTQRGNPLYTTRVPGLTFGLPRAFMVVVPGGKHSVYVKPLEGPFDFAYSIFQVTAVPPEDLRK
jgi:hypothetical protein